MDLRAPVPGGSAVRAVVPRSGLSLPSLGRTLGLLYLCGGLVALGWLQAPHGGPRGDGTVLAMALLGVGLGAVLAACAQRLVASVLHVVLALIQVVVAVGCVATGRPDTDLHLFFLWAAPYSALYFGHRAAAAHLTWTGLVASASVVAVPGPAPEAAVAGLLLLLSTLCAAAVLVGVAARALRRAEAVARRQASHDALTGLGNRRTLLAELGAPAAEDLSALVLLDLDGFKAVNDRYGHARGDEVLQEVAARLTSVVRVGDVVCRLGGDEFAVVVHGLRDEADARRFAARVSDAVDLLVSAQELEADRASRPLAVRASTGVRLLGPDGPDSTTALRHADVALYASKTAGRATVELWRPGMRRAGEELDELSEDLRQALQEGDQLRLVYQPVVDARTLRVRGVEALARWRHPVRGDVPPDVFVGCAERSGLVGELTRWVLRTACAEASRWPLAADGSGVNLAVNISALQLADLTVVADVRRVLAASDLHGGLVLEVTETAEVVDLALARRTLSALAELGVGLALDDFGTGHSSLTHVQSLPFQILKIDRSFVAAAGAGDRRALATIAAVGALASGLGVDVVAEGVEDPAQLPDLLAGGCSYAQGFGLSRPVEAGVVGAALTAHPDGWVLGTVPQSA